MTTITVYNKAVRDRIPEIIIESGLRCTYKVLSDEEFLTYLEKKLHEELSEYDTSKSVMELADLIEIVYRIAELRDTSIVELEKIRVEKQKKRGGFEKNLFLIETK